MHVEFWFDPICPFCWMTSRWIRLVAPERDLEITWRPISLLFKNEMTEEYPFFERATASLALLRVVEAARVRVGDAVVGDLYTEFGRAIHQRQAEVDLAGVLVGLDLDADLADGPGRPVRSGAHDAARPGAAASVVGRVRGHGRHARLLRAQALAHLGP